MITFGVFERLKGKESSERKFADKILKAENEIFEVLGIVSNRNIDTMKEQLLS